MRTASPARRGRCGALAVERGGSTTTASNGGHGVAAARFRNRGGPAARDPRGTACSLFRPL